MSGSYWDLFYKEIFIGGCVASFMLGVIVTLIFEMIVAREKKNENPR